MSKELEALESIMLRAKEGRNKEQQKYIESNYELVKQALIEQEKKDELFELYKEYFQIVESCDNGLHYRMNEIIEKIKAQEEELE